MRKLHELRETRAAKVAEMQGLVSTAENANRDLAESEQARFDALKGEVRSLDQSISNAEHVAELERRADADPVTQHGGLGELEARYSISKALGEFTDTGRLTGLEAEWSQENRSGRKGAFAVPTSAILGIDRRALLTTTPAGGPGGNLVPTTLGPLQDRIRQTLVTESLGATVLSGLTGNLDLPKLKASGQAFWVGEHEPVTRSDPLFDKTSMAPKTVGAEYEVSRRMLLQVAALETILRQDLSYLLREALDLAALAGVGGDMPVGVLHTPGLKVLSGTYADPDDPSSGEIMNLTADMIGSIDPNAPGPRGFVINQRTRTTAMKLSDTTGQPYGVPAVFHNEPVALSNQLPSNLGLGTNQSALIYGAWASLIIGYWSAVDILPNPYHADVASKGGLLIHAFLDADVAVRRVEDFVAHKTLATS
ncbi:phage major capsid protein [Microvirga aerophila]|uniref:Phage capsid-like C-terminal domain-containing protein n=1 Tax=Microvirga aerophila TaxID=670291 RepID=A0A512C1I2_9HYPH|nr:phage major capsid protein [Microvirga aerophila]GEO18074.1 hypothetical protein MAE02_57700 [Microvirga aerophila]